MPRRRCAPPLDDFSLAGLRPSSHTLLLCLQLPAAVEATGPNPDTEWLLSLAQGLAASSTEEEPLSVSLDDVVAKRTEALVEAAAAALAKTLADAPPEVAARAVGAALGQNPFPPLIPCHRVVAASGEITGFAFGLAWKRGLLSLEARQMALF